MTGRAIRGDVPFQIAEVDNSSFLLSKFMNIIRNKMLGRAQDPRANGAWLSKLLNET